MSLILAALLITCSGTWAPDVSEQKLIRTYGAKAIERGMVYVAEGTEEPGSILFPNDEKQRVEIVWKDKKQRRRPEWIRVPAGSQWLTFSGIHNGMSLAEVEKLNGRPFKLNGFDWDYGGMVTDWQAGRLANAGSPCRLQIRFDRNVPERMTKAQQRAADATSGEGELASNAPALRQFSVRVSEIVIQY